MNNRIGNSSPRRGLLAGVFAALVALTIFGSPSVATAQLVSGLGGPSGSTVGPDGAIYVAEGLIGRVSRVDPTTGERSTLISGLPTGIIGFGGPVDVAFIGDTAYVLVSTVGDPLLGAGAIDGIYRVDGPTSFTVIADLGSYSAANLPDPSIQILLVNGLQYALETFRGGFLVTDGHHNRVLQVTRDGEISEFKAFGNIVPTGLEVHGNTVYMAESGPAPHFPEDGKIVAINAKSRAVAEVASGAPLLVDVEFGRGQTLYGLAQGFWDGAVPGDPANPFTGSLVRVNHDGTFHVLATSLNLPSSVEFIGNTAYVVSLAGKIWAIPDVSGPPFGNARSRR
ncbi:MAG: ScyD/ScyE family protein [Gammaproteobacteria bacterium]|jgi:hypothetical protein